MKRSKYFLLLLQLTIVQFSNGQTSVDSVVFPIKEITMDAKLLIGFWQSADSLKNKIEFLDHGYEIVLKTGPDVRPYFFSMDERRKVFASGYFPNWPPYNCDLKFIAPDTLQLDFNQLGVTSFKELYVRSGY